MFINRPAINTIKTNTITLKNMVLLFKKRINTCLVILTTLFTTASIAADQVTLSTLLQEMTSRTSIAKWPEPHFLLKQMSSYDRMSVSPEKPGWFANYDLSTFMRVDTLNGRREFVLFDHNGPGAVVRFWMTFAGIHPGEGKMRIYIDNSVNPVIEGSPFDIISGGLLAPEPISASVSKDYRYDRRGHNLYLPIPYAERCIITYESDNVYADTPGFGGENVYYNINYREYAKGTDVVSFSLEQLNLNKPLIEMSAAQLNNLPADERRGDNHAASLFTLEGGEVHSIKYQGEAAISLISLKLEGVSDSNNDFLINQALRSTVIEIRFDGKKCVWSPVGDFFGTGYILSPHSTFFTNIKEDGTMESFWVMPYKEEAEIKLINHNNFDLKISFETTVCEWSWDERSMHFYSSWREFNRLDAGGVKSNAEFGEGAFDVNYVEIKGKGVLAGDALTLFNSAYAWWGEGDEKIYVDRESFPSNFGTGTEDYYGYAWCRPEKFTDHPFISQPDGSGNLEAGYTVNLRYRSLDKLPFNNHLRFDMEVWTWTDAILNFAPVTFFYLKPQHGNEILFPDQTGTLIGVNEGVAKEVVTNRLQLVPAIVARGRTEFDQLYFYKKSTGRISFDRSVNFETSNKAFVNWSGATEGDSLVVKLYSERPRAFNKVSLAYVCGQNFGSFKLFINGREVDYVFDGYSPKPLVKEISLHDTSIVEGENTILIVNLGKSNANQLNSFVGIDFIALDY